MLSAPVARSASLSSPQTPPSSPPGSTLKPLSPVDMKPSTRATAASPISSLSSSLLRIEHIEVRKTSKPDDAGKNPTYVISIYFEEPDDQTPLDATHASTLPAKQAYAASSRQPDVQVRRSISQFATLRNSLHSCVQTRHHGTSTCGFCEPLARYFTFGEARQMAFATLLFSPRRDASAELAAFVECVMRNCQRLLSSDTRGSCRGQQQLPSYMRTFLLSPE